MPQLVPSEPPDVVQQVFDVYGAILILVISINLLRTTGDDNRRIAIDQVAVGRPPHAILEQGAVVHLPKESTKEASLVITSDLVNLVIVATTGQPGLN